MSAPIEQLVEQWHDALDTRDPDLIASTQKAVLAEVAARTMNDDPRAIQAGWTPPPLPPIEQLTPIQPVNLAPGADPHGEPAFDADAYRVPVPTARSRRADRQRRQFALGYHPVGDAYRLNLAAHPDRAPYDDREAPGLRCGSCLFWQVLDYRKRQYPKCMAPGHAYEGHEDTQGRTTVRGKGMDVPAWMPACKDHQPVPPLPLGGVGRQVGEPFALELDDAFVIARWAPPDRPEDNDYNVPTYWTGKDWERYDPDTEQAPHRARRFATQQAAAAAYAQQVPPTGTRGAVDDHRGGGDPGTAAAAPSGARPDRGGGAGPM